MLLKTYQTGSTQFVAFFNCACPLPQVESLASRNQPVSPPVHTSLHFGLVTWIMTISTPVPCGLSSNKFSRTCFFRLPRPYAFKYRKSHITGENVERDASGGKLFRVCLAPTASVVPRNHPGAAICLRCVFKAPWHVPVI